MVYVKNYQSEVQMCPMLYETPDHIVISLGPVFSMAPAPVVQGSPSTGIHTVYITAILYHEIYTSCCEDIVLIQCCATLTRGLVVGVCTCLQQNWYGILS